MRVESADSYNQAPTDTKLREGYRGDGRKDVDLVSKYLVVSIEITFMNAGGLHALKRFDCVTRKEKILRRGKWPAPPVRTACSQKINTKYVL